MIHRSQTAPSRSFMSILIAFLSLVIERTLGYPDWLFRAMATPSPGLAG